MLVTRFGDMMTRIGFVVALVITSALLATGCGDDDTRRGGTQPDGSIDSMVPAAKCEVGGASIICQGNVAVTCNADGTEGNKQTCSADQGCTTNVGCTTCAANTYSCEGNSLRQCAADGTAWNEIQVCDPSAGESCSPTGYCASPCADAEKSNSYIGCEYWPVTSINAVNTEFDFAVVVANPQANDAQVTVTRGAASVASVTVPAGGIETIRLDRVTDLQMTQGLGASFNSVLARGAAYRLKSNLPVSVYQFSPLEYEISRDCPNEPLSPPIAQPGDNKCNSFSNDASLLLPTHVLTGEYVVSSWPTRANPATGGFLGQPASSTPGFVAITATEDNTTVNVTPSADLLASSDNGATIGAARAGTPLSFLLDRGDVLQLLSAADTQCSNPVDDQCPPRRDRDLSGTRISSEKKLSVLGGHACAFVPFNRWACDHLEEAVFPLESWGKDYVVSASKSLKGEPNVIRIQGGTEATMLTFDPAVKNATMLAAGEVFEFESTQSFRVSGTKAFAVSQFLVGQNYGGGDPVPGEVGDPSMSMAIPTEQFRTTYTFLAPESFEKSFVNVTAPAGANVMLDGNAVTGFSPVGASGMSVAQVSISGGAHSMSSDQKFGIVVYGFGAYTSYMYPGGLDFEEINIIE